MKKKEISKQTKKKILNILIESLQNLYHHSRDIKYNSTDFDSSLINSSFLQFSPVKDGFQIMTANIIDEKHKHLISNKIDAVNKMNKEEIRFQYRDILNNGNFSEKGTAGLGFLDIARKSENKLEYKIEKINEEISFFILKIKIN